MGTRTEAGGALLHEVPSPRGEHRAELDGRVVGRDGDGVAPGRVPRREERVANPEADEDEDLGARERREGRDVVVARDEARERRVAAVAQVEPDVERAVEGDDGAVGPRESNVAVVVQRRVEVLKLRPSSGCLSSRCRKAFNCGQKCR